MRRARRDLGTIIRNTGINYSLARNTWLTPECQYVAMGFPVTSDQQMLTNSTCHVSRVRGERPAELDDHVDITIPDSRTQKSKRTQVGNSMHINSIGSSMFLFVLMFPSVGKRTTSTTPSLSSSSSCACATCATCRSPSTPVSMSSATTEASIETFRLGASSAASSPSYVSPPASRGSPSSPVSARGSPLPDSMSIYTSSTVEVKPRKREHGPQPYLSYTPSKLFNNLIIQQLKPTA
jgi:hypothetical protein